MTRPVLSVLFSQADAAKKELLLSLRVDGEVDIHRGEFRLCVEIKVKTNSRKSQCFTQNLTTKLKTLLQIMLWSATPRGVLHVSSGFSCFLRPPQNIHRWITYTKLPLGIYVCEWDNTPNSAITSSVPSILDLWTLSDPYQD